MWKVSRRSSLAASRAFSPAVTSSMTSLPEPPASHSPTPRRCRDHDEGEHGDGRPSLRLPARRRGGHATVAGPTARQELLEAGDRAAGRAAGGRSRAAGTGADRRHAAADGVGKRDRRSVRRAGQRLGRAGGNQAAALAGRRDLHRLDGDRPVTAGAAGGDEAPVNPFHGRLGMERVEGVLQLVGAERCRHVARHEDHRVPGRHLAAPDVRREVVRGQADVGVGVGERQQVRLVDEVRLHRSRGRHVELAPAHHGDAQPDGAAVLAAEAQAVAVRGELPVRRPDRLLQAHGQPRRLVVVVLALHRVRDEPGGLLQPPGAPHAGDDDVEAPLGSRRRPDRGLDDGDRVRGILQALALGNHAELHLQSDGHRLTRRWRGGRRDAGRPGRAVRMLARRA